MDDNFIYFYDIFVSFFFIVGVRKFGEHDRFAKNNGLFMETVP